MNSLYDRLKKHCDSKEHVEVNNGTISFDHVTDKQGNPITFTLEKATRGENGTTMQYIHIKGDGEYGVVNRVIADKPYRMWDGSTDPVFIVVDKIFMHLFRNQKTRKPKSNRHFNVQYQKRF